MLAFEGTSVPPWLEERLQDAPPAGVTLFREWNMESPEQTAELTGRLQELNSGPLPLLIAADQEGGQLIGVTGSTPFAGNMALGAAGDEDLATRVAAAIGAETRAVGINVDYAPVADVATRADNPSLGVRSFGENPATVARLTAATVRALGEAGVVSAVKHFPGQGDIAVDPHYELPILDFDRERLEEIELPPFRAAVGAGVGMVMVGHYVVPALTGGSQTPIFASVDGIDGFVRHELGYDGVVITDALDMGALDQGPAQAIEVVAMMRAGVDLLMCMPDPDLQARVRTAVERGQQRDLVPESALLASRARIARLRTSLAPPRPEPGLVGDPAHGELAEELARRSVTVVRNDEGLLPLRLEAGSRILSVEPMPTNVTPADTTALYPPLLASSLRAHHEAVTELVIPHRPEAADIAGVVDQAREHDAVVVGTVNAGVEQGALVDAVRSSGKPMVTVALRAPYDLAVYPAARTHLCTYSGLGPSLAALAEIVFVGGGRGKLPAAIPGLYPIGHGIAV